MKHASMMPVSLAAALMLATAPALANSEARAYIGPISYTLKDLDLTDGFSPSVTFTASEEPAEYKADAFAYAHQESLFDIDRAGASPWASVDASAATPGSQSRASFSSGLNGGFTGASLSTQGSAVSGPPLTSTNGYTTGVSTGNWTMTLSPHTEVTFNAMGGVFAAVSPVPPLSGSADAFDPTDHAYASAHFDAQYFLDGQGHAVTDLFTVQVSNARDGNSLPSASDEHRFSLPLANSTADSLAIHLSAGAHVFGSAVSPVPEPAALALWASGMGLVAGAFRRRGKRPDAKKPFASAA